MEALAVTNRELRREIGQREVAEEFLRQSEKRFSRLYESMMDAFIIVDMAGRIQESNSVYRELLGYPEEELRRLTYVELTPEHWHANEARIMRGPAAWLFGGL